MCHLQSLCLRWFRSFFDENNLDLFLIIRILSIQVPNCTNPIIMVFVDGIYLETWKVVTRVQFSRLRIEIQSKDCFKDWRGLLLIRGQIKRRNLRVALPSMSFLNERSQDGFQADEIPYLQRLIHHNIGLFHSLPFLTRENCKDEHASDIDMKFALTLEWSRQQGCFGFKKVHFGENIRVTF